MKPTVQIELALETDLLFCSRLGLGLVNCRFTSESLILRLVVVVYPFFAISGQPDTKRAFHGRLTKLFDVVPNRSAIET